MNSDSDNAGMTVLAVAFRLARGRPICCYMCKHSDAGMERVCTIGRFDASWRKLWDSLKAIEKFPPARANYSVAEFCNHFKYSDGKMFNSADQRILRQLTKV